MFNKTRYHFGNNSRFFNSHIITNLNLGRVFEHKPTFETIHNLKIFKNSEQDTIQNLQNVINY